MNVADEILAIYQKCGSSAYFGESVSMTEHALQAAYFARTAGAPPGLVVAALLHDIGHLVDENHHDAIVILIEQRVCGHDAVAGLDADVPIRRDLHHVTSRLFSP